MAGLVPGRGEVADGADAALYLVQNDTKNALVAFAAMGPVVGAGATLGEASARMGADAAENLVGAGARRGPPNAATGVARELPSGPKIAGEWGADTYRHGGLMSTIEHINYRHAYGSGFSGVSRFAEGTSARDIKGYVDDVLRSGSVTDRGMVGSVGRTIGTDARGYPATGLEVIVRGGMIKTAYPVTVR